MKTRLKVIGLILLCAVALGAQQGTTILKNYNSGTQAKVESNNALKVNTYASDGSSLLPSTDPCFGVIGTTVPISITADTVVISASSGKKNHICGGELIASGGAEIFNIVEGTGTTCQTNTVALVGSTTDANGLSFAVNGGFIISRPIFGSGTNVDTCVRLSGTNRTAGHIIYVQP